MRARVIIEYDVPNGDRIALRDREEQRWITNETLLALPTAAVNVDLIDGAGVSLRRIRKSSDTISLPSGLLINGSWRRDYREE